MNKRAILKENPSVARVLYFLLCLPSYKLELVPVAHLLRRRPTCSLHSPQSRRLLLQGTGPAPFALSLPLASFSFPQSLGVTEMRICGGTCALPLAHTGPTTTTPNAKQKRVSGPPCNLPLSPVGALVLSPPQNP